MKRFLCLFSILFLALSPVAYSRPTSSSGSHSSSHSSSGGSHSSSTSGSSSHSSPSSGWGSSAPRSGSGSSGFSHSTGSHADDALSNKVRQSGPSPQSRGDFVDSHRANDIRNSSDYRTRYRPIEPAYRYNPSYSYRWNYRPSIWPYYVPHSYFWDGLMYTLIWNDMYHSYGWYGPGNTWMNYDQAAQRQTVIENDYNGGSRGGSGIGGLVAMAIIMFVILGIVLVVWLCTRESSSSRRSYDEGFISTLPEAPVRPKNGMLTKALHKGDLAAVRPGDEVLLKDKQSMGDAVALHGPKAKGLIFTANSITRLTEANSLADWTFIDGRGENHQDMTLMVKNVDGQRLMCCYTEDLDPATREELVNGEHTEWLFDAPDNGSMNLQKLNYTKWFNRELVAGTTDEYNMKGQGELHGKATFEPKRSGQASLLGTVAEYHCDREQDNQEYLVLELGNDGNRSLVSTYWGAKLTEADVEVL